MREEFMIAGLGGQGNIFAANLLGSTAAIFAGKHTCFIKSYGPESRGGKAGCWVAISDEEGGLPDREHPDVLIAMNAPSLAEYAPLVKSGGLIIINASLIESADIGRKDVEVLRIKAVDIAEKELGDKKVANLVLLGAYLKKRNPIKWDDVMRGLEYILKDEGKEKYLEINKRALERGAKEVEAH